MNNIVFFFAFFVGISTGTYTSTYTSTLCCMLWVHVCVCVGAKFGDIVEDQDVKASYKEGETVTASFYSGNPRYVQADIGVYGYIQGCIQ